MTAIAVHETTTNEALLIEAGVTLDHLTPEIRERIGRLSPEELQVVIDLKMRFGGELPLDPGLFKGSDAY